MQKGINDVKYICVEGNNMEEKQLGMLWYNFYNKIRISLGILMVLGSTITNFNSYKLYEFSIGIIYILFLSILFYGMLKFKKWAYPLIFVSLLLEVLSLFVEKLNTETFSAAIGVLVIMSLVWVLPNTIYFSKRKFLFENKLS